MELSTRERYRSLGVKNPFHRVNSYGLKMRSLRKNPYTRDFLRSRRVSSGSQTLTVEIPNSSLNVSQSFSSPEMDENSTGPRPLLSPQEVERLRANLRMATDRLTNPYADIREYEYECNSSSPFSANCKPWEMDEYHPSGFSPKHEPLDMDEYYSSEFSLKHESSFTDEYPTSELSSKRQPLDTYESLQEEGNTQQQFCIEDYLREEENTKRQLEEIILVAQKLREKLESEERMRQVSELVDSNQVGLQNVDIDEDIYEFRSHLKAESCAVPEYNTKTLGNIPRLMDLKPNVIPSLLDVRVPPPPIEKVIKEKSLTANNMYEPQAELDICWNCEMRGHKFTHCQLPKLKRFCFRCGHPGFDVTSCPYCKMVAKK